MVYRLFKWTACGVEYKTDNKCFCDQSLPKVCSRVFNSGAPRKLKLDLTTCAQVWKSGLFHSFLLLIESSQNPPLCLDTFKNADGKRSALLEKKKQGQAPRSDGNHIRCCLFLCWASELQEDGSGKKLTTRFLSDKLLLKPSLSLKVQQLWLHSA